MHALFFNSFGTDVVFKDVNEDLEASLSIKLFFKLIAELLPLLFAEGNFIISKI